MTTATAARAATRLSVAPRVTPSSPSTGSEHSPVVFPQEIPATFGRWRGNKLVLSTDLYLMVGEGRYGKARRVPAGDVVLKCQNCYQPVDRRTASELWPREL